MTRFKEYIRKAGIKLENDYPYMPYDSIETVETYFDTELNYIVVLTYHVSAGWLKLYIDRFGNIIDADTAQVTYKDEWQASK